MDKNIYFTHGKEINMSALDESLFVFQPPVESEEIERVISKPYNYWRSVWTTLFRSKLFIVATVLVFVILLLAFIVPYGKDVFPFGSSSPVAAPSIHHLFGIGNNGEDFWNTIWNGTRTTLIFALVLMVVQLAIGLSIGLLWGYGIFHDIFWNWLVRIFTIVPSTIFWFFIIFLYKVSGIEENMYVVVFGVALGSWSRLAQAIKNEVRKVVNSNLNANQKSFGISGYKIFARNILPNVLLVIFRTAAFTFSEAIAVDSTLSFFGLSYISSTDISMTSLGNILTSTLMSPNWESYPHLIIIPFIMVILIPLTFNYILRSISRSLNSTYHIR